MTPLVRHLAKYAAYHQKHRNVFLHFIGIPALVIAITALLSRPVVPIGAIDFTPATAIAGTAAVFYLLLDVRYGLVLIAFFLLALAAGSALASTATPIWMATGIGLFVVGWIIQFVGHHFEGRKPAFFDDITGLIIGPLFVVAEVSFMLGWRRDLRDAVQANIWRWEAY